MSAQESTAVVLATSSLPTLPVVSPPLARVERKAAMMARLDVLEEQAEYIRKAKGKHL